MESRKGGQVGLPTVAQLLQGGAKKNKKGANASARCRSTGASQHYPEARVPDPSQESEASCAARAGNPNMSSTRRPRVRNSEGTVVRSPGLAEVVHVQDLRDEELQEGPTKRSVCISPPQSIESDTIS